MAFGNYGQLKTAVALWLNRDDLTASLPDFIRLAQVRLTRAMKDWRARSTSVTLSASPTTLPATYGTVYSIALQGRGPLQIVTPQRLETELAHFADVAGLPRYAVLTPGLGGGATLRTAPTPDGSYVLEIEYQPSLVAFSADTDTDDILTNFPDLYLNASMAEAEAFLKNPEELAVWEQKLSSALEETRQLLQRRRFPNTPVERPRRPLGE